MDKEFQSRSKSNKTFSETSSDDGCDNSESNASSQKKGTKDFAAKPELYITPDRQIAQQQAVPSHKHYRNPRTERIWAGAQQPIPNLDTSSPTRSSGID